MPLQNTDDDAAKVYNGTVNATKVEVTDNPSVLIQSISLLNATAAEAYFLVFDLDADDVTVGTTTPTFIIGVGAEGNPQLVFVKPIRFNNGLTIASTTTRGGNTDAVMEVTITYNDSNVA